MKILNKKRQLLVLFIVFGFLASLFAVVERHQAEQSFNYYEVTMPYEQVLAMAELKDTSIEAELKFWRDAGIHSITLNELNLRQLSERTDVDLSFEYIGNNLVITGEKALITDLAKRFKLALKDREIDLEDDRLVIEGSVNDFYVGGINSKNVLTEESSGIKVRSASLLEFVGLGYEQADIDTIKASGMVLRFRPIYSASLQNYEYAISNFFDLVDKYSHQPYVFFAGKEILAFGGGEEILADSLVERNMAVGMVENSVQRKHLKQAGLNNLVERLDYRAVRVFSTWDYIRNRYDYEMPLHHHGEEIINTYFRAITERNINVIYFKPFTINNRLLNLPLEIYQKDFKLLERRLKTHNIIPYPEDSSVNFYRQSFNSSKWIQLLAALAVMAAGLLLLDLLFDLPAKLIYAVFAFASFFVVLLYYLGKALSLLNSLFGLLATIIFASLATVYMLKKAHDVYSGKIKAKFKLTGNWLLYALLISMVGAVLETAFFSQSKYILEMAIFRGVKISQFLPLVLAVIFAFIIFEDALFEQGDLPRKERIKLLLNQSIKVWQMLLAGVGLVFVILLLARSGHETSVKPMSIELLFRNTLEFFVYARPRSKSFIIAFPAFFIFFNLLNMKKFKWLYPFFAFLIAIGPADVLNTFSHFRTPLFISGFRVMNAYVFGIALYGLLYLAYIILKKIWEYGRKYFV